MNTTTRNARHKPLTPIPHSLKVLKEKYVKQYTVQIRPANTMLLQRYNNVTTSQPRASERGVERSHNNNVRYLF